MPRARQKVDNYDESTQVSWNRSRIGLFTIVPRHVLGGPGVVPPSDKITLAHIGTGTEGLREMPRLIAIPEIQIVAVCDPSKYAIGYRDWAMDDLLNVLRADPWKAGLEGRDRGD